MKAKTKNKIPAVVQNIRTGEMYKPTGVFKYIDGVKFTEVVTDKGQHRFLKSDSLRQYSMGVIDNES